MSRSHTPLPKSIDAERDASAETQALLDNEGNAIDTEEARVRFTSSVFSGTESPSPPETVTSETDNGETNPIRSFWYILLLTVVIGGLQLSWSAEFSNGTPYLLSLGMSKSLMSLVWIAGPMSGTLGQPIVGMLSDDLRWSFGRRRPFMILGAVATIISLLCLSWSMNIVGFFTGTSDNELLKQKTIPFAVFFVYSLDFSISIIQAASRAFIVDNVPTSQQAQANAWAARMIGIGNIAGFVLGSLNLPKLYPWLGHTQFQGLSSCACLALIVTVLPACVGISEQNPMLDVTLQTPNSRRGLIGIWSETLSAIRHLSPQTKLACEIEFFAWIGYFPMLFYSSTYVGTLYKQGHRDANGPISTPELDEEATRRGSLALLAFAIVSLIGNFLLPYLSKDSYTTTEPTKLLQRRSQFIPCLWKRITGLFLHKLTVNQLWIVGHFTFVFATFMTAFITTSWQASVFIAVLGIPWALALWAPFVIISEEVSRIKSKKGMALQLAEMRGGDENGQLRRRRQRFEGYEHNAGIILGVHNVFVALPQVVSSLVASALFKILDSPAQSQEIADPTLLFARNGGGGGGESANSLGWVFRFGGIATVVAIWLSFKLKNKHELDADDDTFEDMEE